MSLLHINDWSFLLGKDGNSVGLEIDAFLVAFFLATLHTLLVIVGIPFMFGVSDLDIFGPIPIQDHSNKCV